jgi:Uma2 family endonuclease
MQIELPDIGTRATIDVPGDRPMDDDQFFEFCAKNPELQIERDGNGKIIIMPPSGFETEHRNSEICRQLGNWAEVDGRGLAVGSNTEFFLANGAARGPDAAWIHASRLDQFDDEEVRKFLHLCPEFVVELVSPSDRINKVKAKMREWMDNGVLLGWLIDADHRTVYVYRPGREPEALVDADRIDGEGPVEGFRLDLSRVWKRLKPGGTPAVKPR